LREQPHVLVIDGFDFFHAELAYFLAPEILAAAAFATSGTAGGARGTALSAIRAVSE
jgi:hypothetical protein